MPDLFPEDLERWHYFESKLFQIFHSFDVNEIRTPLLESTELFSRSVGNSSDIVNKELYSFLDRNKESISLRPEGSASIVRAIIQKKLEQEKHKLWYQGPMFRYERPQKGRFRQFHQIGVEYLGFNEGAADHELISMILQINQSLGISEYTLKINHLGDTDAKESFCKSLVRFLKPNANELHDKDKARLASNPLRILEAVRLLGLDRLNSNNDPQYDGNFDFVEGFTINPERGNIIFPVLEPFGSTLDSYFQESSEVDLSERYVYKELYEMTQDEAEKVLSKNKFFIVGTVSSGSGSEINLPGLGISENSVVVTAGNLQLVEGTDYTVNYNLGSVRIFKMFLGHF